MNLLECSKEFWLVVESLHREAEESGEWPLDAAERLDRASSNYTDKLRNAGVAYKTLRASAEAVNAESKKLKNRADRLERQADHLRMYIQMSLPEGEKFETAEVAMKWRASEAVEVTNILDVPPEYWREKVVREPDKNLLKKALKAAKPGEWIPGAKLERRMNLQIE